MNAPPRRRRARALIFGLAISGVALLASEGVARLWLGSHKPKLELQEIGRRGASIKFKATLRTDARTLWEATYTIEPPGNKRAVPVSASGARWRPVLFLGCSFTFGEGVEDAETLPAQTAERLPWAKPINLGKSGWGTHHVLSRLEDGIAGVGTLDHPIAVSTYMDDHVRRALGSLHHQWSQGQSPPWYELEEGKLVRRGTFADRGWQRRVYPVLEKSALLELLGLDWPLRLREQDRALEIALTVACRDAFERRWPDGKFLVVIYPGSKHASWLVPALEKAHVSCLDLSALFDPKEPGLSLPDQHPTPEAYRRVGVEVAKKLEADSSR